MEKQEDRLSTYKSRGEFENSTSIYLDFNYTFEMAFSYISRNIPVVLFGPPGTGKTYIIEKIKKKLEEQNKLGNYELVQFHKKFSYEDFIEGFAPNDKGVLTKRDGIFKSFCRNCVKDEDKSNLFVIDELNRAELSTTLGEVLYLLEDRNERSARTSHFSDIISIPRNVSLLGTMNTADRNISSIDFAIRRRFMFIPLFPDYGVLKEVLLSKGWVENDLKISLNQYCTAAEKINFRISNNPIMGRHMQLGHMMFAPSTSSSIITKDNLLEQFIYVILPQLEAYCGFGNDKIIHDIIGETLTKKYLDNKQISFEDIVATVNDIANSQEDGKK